MKPSTRLQIKLTLIFGIISAATLIGIFIYFHTPLIKMLFIFGLAVLAGFLASGLVAKPLTEIAHVAKKMANGDFSEKIYMPPNDIFGELARTFNEISEQVQYRINEVAVEKSRLEAVLLSMIEGVLVVDKQEKVLLMNHAFRELINVADNPVGRKALEVIRNIQVQETIADALRSQKAVESREISILLTEEKILLVHAAPVVLNGSVEGVVLVFHDITELRRLERIRREFVANVSHELRTPASNIKGYTETLLEGALDDKDHAREFLNIIQDNSERLANLIEGLLDLSRIESGKVATNVTPCSLQPIVRKTLEILDNKVKKKNLRVENLMPEKIPQVQADAAQIVQVLVNLVDNAIKYTASGGSIAIFAKEAGRFVQVEVRDSGIGIPDADLPRVFERFYRVDKARSRERGGTGLGLSIVKHIIQAHGGEVSVESRLGEGSTFRFTLPIAGA